MNDTATAPRPIGAGPSADDLLAYETTREARKSPLMLRYDALHRSALPVESKVALDYMATGRDGVGMARAVERFEDVLRGLTDPDYRSPYTLTGVTPAQAAHQAAWTLSTYRTCLNAPHVDIADARTEEQAAAIRLTQAPEYIKGLEDDIAACEATIRAAGFTPEDFA